MRTKEGAVGVVTTTKLRPHIYQRYKVSGFTIAQLIESGLNRLCPEPIETTIELREIQSFGSGEPVSANLAEVVKVATKDSP